VERLGETDAVLVVDETGDLEKGAHTVGVQPIPALLGGSRTPR
jgi:SRSO17 transposase